MSRLNPIFERITHSPHVCHGQPTIRNLRYPVSLLPKLLSGGMIAEPLGADFPALEREDIFAVLVYAARPAQAKHAEPFIS